MHMNVGTPGGPKEVGSLQLKSRVFVSCPMCTFGSSKAMHILTTEPSLHQLKDKLRDHLVSAHPSLPESHVPLPIVTDGGAAFPCHLRRGGR